MSNITLGGNLPNNDQHNGLDVIHDDLVKDPSKRRVAVVFIDAQKLVTKVDDGEVSPVLRIRRVEVALTDKDAKALTEIMDRLSQDRLGMLPIEGDPEDADGDDGGDAA